MAKDPVNTFVSKLLSARKYTLKHDVGNTCQTVKDAYAALKRNYEAINKDSELAMARFYNIQIKNINKLMFAETSKSYEKFNTLNQSALTWVKNILNG